MSRRAYFSNAGVVPPHVVKRTAHNRVDILGMRFGRLTATRDTGANNKDRSAIWEFACDCGKVITARATDVRTGKTKSCGCLQRQKVITPEYIDPNVLHKRFIRHIDHENKPEPTVCSGFGPCLLWIGANDGSDSREGRAQMAVHGHKKKAAHVAWFLTYGYWPEYLCHRCDNRMCVNTDHLFEGDDSLNMYDRQTKGLGGIQVP